MTMQLLGPTRDGDADESFACFGFRGGLNIKDMPQELDDGDLTVAYNVYLRSDGGIEQRKGMNARGGPLHQLVNCKVARIVGGGFVPLEQQTGAFFQRPVERFAVERR